MIDVPYFFSQGCSYYRRNQGPKQLAQDYTLYTQSLYEDIDIFSQTFRILSHTFMSHTLHNNSMFLVTFSIYSLLLFGDLCHPVDEKYDNRETFNWSMEISCKEASVLKPYWIKNLTQTNEAKNVTTMGWEIYESIINIDNSWKYSIAQFSWIVLIIFTCIFCIREVVECLSLQRKFFKNFDSYRHIIIDILLILCLIKGFPVANFKVQRWQYHVATFTSFSLWFQMMIVAGKYPGYGKYIYMFKFVFTF